MYRVRAVLRTDGGTYVEYVTPRMGVEEAYAYAFELREGGTSAEVIAAEYRDVTFREIVPLVHELSR